MEFRTIKEDGKVQEEIKKSRFICHAKRVYSEEEARDFITAIKKNTTKLRITALPSLLGNVVKSNGQVMNGEPSGTAGVPMLGVLVKSQSHQSLCSRDTLLWWH